MSPRFAWAWHHKGNSLRSLSRYDEVIDGYNNALKVDPGYADAWYSKALTEEKNRRFGEAAKSYRHFLDVVPPQDTTQVQNARQRTKELEG